MAEPFLLKNIFDTAMIERIASYITKAYPSFDTTTFTNRVLDDYEPLGLNERSSRICDTLYALLPKDFETASSILVGALDKEIEEEELSGYDNFYVLPFTLYISRYGLEYITIALPALQAMTRCFSSEFAIRYFLLHHEEETLHFLRHLATSDNCHERRLVSEGSRPRLPWGIRLQPYIKDPTTIFELLTHLKNEPTRLVQRSIANSLNDIAKDHPDAVCNFLQAWKKENVLDIEWIIRHATRTLIKQGYPVALQLLGFEPDITIDVSHCNIQTPTLTLGERLSFTFDIVIKKEAKLVIDYAIGFMKANGTRSDKTFKLKQGLFPAGKTRLQKLHLLAPQTTRKYYSGTHTLSIYVNGNLQSHTEFTLICP